MGGTNLRHGPSLDSCGANFFFAACRSGEAPFVSRAEILGSRERCGDDVDAMAKELEVSKRPTAKQLKALAKAGYKTVIDLRLPEEEHGFDEAKAARKADLEFSSIPVMPEMLDASTVKFFLTVLGNAQRPVLIHCSSGARAAGLYYAWLVLEQGLAEEEARAKAQAAGLTDPGLAGKMQQVVFELKSARRPKE